MIILKKSVVFVNLPDLWTNRTNQQKKQILVGGAITILKNMKVNGKDYPHILWKIKNV